MTVKELSDILIDSMANGLNPQANVEIVIQDKRHIAGPIPAVPIAFASAGFDWNAGRFLIQPQADLEKVD